MLQRYILTGHSEAIAERFGVKASLYAPWEPPVIVIPGHETPIITQQKPTELTLSTFGMTPCRAKNKMLITHARAEGDKNQENSPEFKGSKAIFLKPAFQKPLFSQRCIIVADAFIEQPAGIFTHPYLIYLRQRQHPIGLAGLYDLWINPVNNEPLHSFTMITVAANSLMRSLPAARMPVILPFGQESRWLKPTLSLAEILRFLTKYPSKQMNAYPLSSKVMQAGPFTREILQPTGAKLFTENQSAAIPRSSYYGHRKKNG
ncbi:MAG: SOS response-associated peptidase [Lentimicrobium sp.]|nr:SOS response-associated peptidase [Lentimicrobium sp.]